LTQPSTFWNSRPFQYNRSQSNLFLLLLESPAVSSQISLASARLPP
jgi:hypothetical protein